MQVGKQAYEMKDFKQIVRWREHVSWEVGVRNERF